jgi:L-aminopeptidase/D-esterase-like protein
VLRPGPKNLITDVAGLTVGQAEDERAQTGVTVVLCGADWAAGVDVRGGGPGVRETETLAAENLVGRAHAITLAGGSVYGLAAADGVVSALAARGVGLHLRSSLAIPIVPCAVLHDLASAGDKDWGATPPYRELGLQASRAAGADFALGSKGAGRGAMAGLRKGGVGSASLELGDGLIVAALVAVNSVGSAFMPDGKTYWAWAFELEHEFGGTSPPGSGMDLSDPAPDGSRLAEIGRFQAGANTTIGVIATTADLSTPECKRVAMMAHDGIARAIRPAHTPFDGDTLFALASGAVTIGRAPLRAAQLARIGSAAADCVTRAIARAVHYAR